MRPVWPWSPIIATRTLRGSLICRAANGAAAAIRSDRRLTGEKTIEYHSYSARSQLKGSNSADRAPQTAKELKFVIRFAVLLLALPLLGQEQYDLVIANGTVIDGSGAEGKRADVGVRAGKIAAIGDLHDARAKRTVDASGLIVAPGFIDIHNHSDNTLLAEPKCESMVRQGVTTMVLGEGDSQGPSKPGVNPWTTLGGYFDLVQKKGVATNIASYVGETQLWTYVKGEALAPASPSDMAAMKTELAKAMEEGALGLSSWLLMPPSNLITTGQLIELAKVAQGYGGLYIPGRGIHWKISVKLKVLAVHTARHQGQ